MMQDPDIGPCLLRDIKHIFSFCCNYDISINDWCNKTHEAKGCVFIMSYLERLSVGKKLLNTLSTLLLPCWFKVLMFCTCPFFIDQAQHADLL